MQVIRSGPGYDVVVIGSGAGGGTVVQVLTEKGINVALLEAGPMLNPASEYKDHVWPYQVPDRGAGEDGVADFLRHPFVSAELLASSGGWELEGEPYTVVPGSKFRWFR